MKKFNGRLSKVKERDLILLEKNPNKFWRDVSVIDNSAFDYLSDLRSIEIPSTVQVINSNAFYDCENLESVVLHEGLKEIGGCAFLGCRKLKSIEIPNTVKSLGNNAFSDCINLKSVVLPNGIETLGWNVFNVCTSLEKIEIPESVRTIGETAFKFCVGLKEIIIPENVEFIDERAFEKCYGLEKVVIKSELLNFDYVTFRQIFTEGEFEKTYISKDGKEIVISRHPIENIENTHFDLKHSIDESDFVLNPNYRKNKLQVENWKAENKIKFIPPDYTLKIFPNTEFKNYFVNNNNQFWGKLVKTLEFDKLQGNEKTNSLSDLMKIYYAIGGFSNNQGERDKAFDYVLNHVAKTSKKDATNVDVGNFIHQKFSGINLYGPYNKTFAQFFMKYYKDNPDFLTVFYDYEEYLYNGNSIEPQDFLCAVHNNFNNITKNYPYMVVNGNEERSLLTPKFVIDHSIYVQYENIGYGNQELANLVGKYGYNQNQFDYMQSIFERAKRQEGKQTLKIYFQNNDDAITFRLLAKDDPLGFVLGNITNCCQCIDDAGGSCVVDGYTNQDAGFLVFETEAFENGKKAGTKRILGQAYVWYDPKTKTVCLDNIEIPTKVLKDLRSGENKNSRINISAFLDAVEKSAISLMGAMNDSGVRVDRVPTGEGYNDLKQDLAKCFPIERQPVAKHRGYYGYSDAKIGQFVLETYDEFTKELSQNILKKLKTAKKDLEEIQTKSKDDHSLLWGAIWKI